MLVPMLVLKGIYLGVAHMLCRQQEIISPFLTPYIYRNHASISLSTYYRWPVALRNSHGSSDA